MLLVYKNFMLNVFGNTYNSTRKKAINRTIFYQDKLFFQTSTNIRHSNKSKDDEIRNNYNKKRSDSPSNTNTQQRKPADKLNKFSFIELDRQKYDYSKSSDGGFMHKSNEKYKSFERKKKEKSSKIGKEEKDNKDINQNVIDNSALDVLAGLINKLNKDEEVNNLLRPVKSTTESNSNKKTKNVQENFKLKKDSNKYDKIKSIKENAVANENKLDQFDVKNINNQRIKSEKEIFKFKKSEKFDLSDHKKKNIHLQKSTEQSIKEDSIINIQDMFKSDNQESEINFDNLEANIEVDKSISGTNRINKTKDTIYSRYHDLKSGRGLNLFHDLKSKQTENNRESPIWLSHYDDELKLAQQIPPINGFDEMIMLTNENKLWKFPIDNEQDNDQSESKVPFYEHVFLEEHLEQFPQIEPIQQFMTLALNGISQNSFLNLQEKKDIIEWYKSYFNSKLDIIKESLDADKIEESYRTNNNDNENRTNTSLVLKSSSNNNKNSNSINNESNSQNFIK